MGGSHGLQEASLTPEQIVRLKSLYKTNQSYESTYEHKLVLVFIDSVGLIGGIIWYKTSGYRLLVRNVPNINVFEPMLVNNIYVFNPAAHNPIMREELGSCGKSTLHKYHYYFVADFYNNPNALSDIQKVKYTTVRKRKAPGDEVLPTPPLTPFNDEELRLITDSANGVEEDAEIPAMLDASAADSWEEDDEVIREMLSLIAEGW